MVGENPLPPVDSSAERHTASFNQVAQQINQAREFATLYVTAQIGRLRLGIRNALLFGVFGVVVAIVVSTFAVVAVVLLCLGAAGGIGTLLGGRMWAGDLIVGLIVLVGAAIVSWTLIGQVRKISRRQTVASYLKTNVPVAANK